MATKREAKEASTVSQTREANQPVQLRKKKKPLTERIKRSDFVRVRDAILTATRNRMIADGTSLRRCQSWLTRMATGNSTDIRTNLFITGKNKDGRVHKSYERIGEEFESVYRQEMRSCDPFLSMLIETELEEPNRSKMGPKSMFKGYFEDGPEKVKAVFSDKLIPKTLDMRAFKRALDRLVAEIPSQSIRLRSVEATANFSRDLSSTHELEIPGLDPTTNSGPPFYVSGWRPNPLMDANRLEYAKAVFDWIVKRAKAQYLELSRGEVAEFTAMCGQRIVNRGAKPLEDPKTKRLIIAMEKSNAILWKTFTYDVMQALKQVELNGVLVHNAWMDTPIIDVQQQKLLDLASRSSLKVVSGDLSSFDASVVPSIWDMMAEGMSDWFYRSKTFFHMLNRSDISNVKMLAPDGIWGPTKSSIKSGSGGTNFIDCQYNKLALYYGEELGSYKLLAIEVQGDDFCAVGPGVEPETLSEAYSHFNLTLHPDKQTYVDGALGYLQRLHVRGITGGIASTYRVLNSVLVQERNRFNSDQWNPYMEAIQAIAKLDNAAFAPAFEGLVNYVKSNDKYLLGADQTVQNVVGLAGIGASELLSMGTDSFSTKVMDKSISGFANSPTNGVLRGEHLPDLIGKERFLRVYTKTRLKTLGL